MRRKSCIFAAQYAENNCRIIRTKTGGYVFMGTYGLAQIPVGHTENQRNIG